MLFRNRRDAGRRLAERLVHLKDRHPIVLALPRGGVPVGLEVAHALGGPLDLLFVRKIGAPGQEELAVGAVADGPEPERVTDPSLISALDISADYMEEAMIAALQEIHRRRNLYLGGRQPLPVTGCTAIVVDDGIATGSTIRAALRSVRHRAPARLVLAVPVSPPEPIRQLRKEVDEVVCLHTASALMSVGQFYADFRQLRDDEVTAMLEEASGVSPRSRPSI
jgi:putative phosphoribosyl transferase